MFAAPPDLSFRRTALEGIKECFELLRLRDEFLLFEEQGEVVGIVTVTRGKWRKKHVATIGGLAVPSSHQGKGVATRMKTELVDYLTQEGIRRLEMFVESDNPSAIYLYKKLGFKEEGILRDYFKRETDSSAINELVMARIF